MPYKLLVLTDHAAHSIENSIYVLLRQMLRHPMCAHIDVASRAHPDNDAFFVHYQSTQLHAHRVTDQFEYHATRPAMRYETQPVRLEDYDMLFLRLPRPIPDSFFDFLTASFEEKHIMNRPSGIAWCSRKDFLLHVPELCPPIQDCQDWAHIEQFKARFPIVLKPMRSYGGKGILRIDGDTVWEGNTPHAWSDYAPHIRAELAEEGYLGMQFLKNVDQGDKRVIVVNGEIIGASLRKPPKGAWMCNASLGGSSHESSADADEQRIAQRLSELLIPAGIVMFGFDTLVDDHGRRVLSEVNALSIGGLKQVGQQSGHDRVAQAADLLWQYVDTQRRTS